MYRISDDDVRTLVHINEHHDIRRLTPVLGEKTINILRQNRVDEVGDLIRLEPIAFLEMPGIDPSTREKIMIVCNYLFHGAYDNLHG